MPLLTHVRGPVIPGSVQRVMLACPTTDKYHAPAVATLFEASLALYRAGIMADLCLEVGNPHVDDARNSIVRHMRRTDCTDLFFLDSDVGASADDVVKLCQYDRDIVGGVYPKKSDEEDFPISIAPGVELWQEADGCVSKGVIGLPTGFMRIKRHVLDAMCETFKSRAFKGQGDGPNDPPYIILFERELVNGRRYSGDYNFCRRWIEMGGTLAVDPNMTFVHEGLKQWRGELGAYWRRVHGVADEAFAAAVERLRGGDASPEVIHALSTGWDNGVWQGSHEMLVAAYRLAKRAKGPILECGSGLSTVILALANPGVEVHALESSPIWATKVQEALTRFGLTNATVHYGEMRGRWYDRATLPALPWGLVVCDGPDRRYGDRSQVFQVIDLSQADILADDVDDAGVMKGLQDWASARGRSVRVIEGDAKSFAICLAVEPVAMAAE